GILVSSCKKEDDEPYVKDPLSTSYYPVGVNKYITYDVDSLIWNDSTCEGTYKYQRIRYTIADTFPDEQNRTSFRIETMRFTDSTGWTPAEVYYVTPTASGVEFMEDGNRYIKLSYPVEA